MAAQTISGEPLFERVVEILAPYIGPTTAKASVKMFLKQSGVVPEQFLPEHLAKLAGKLEPGLRVFVGAKTAKALSQRVVRLDGRAT